MDATLLIQLITVIIVSQTEQILMKTNGGLRIGKWNPTIILSVGLSKGELTTVH